LEGKCCPGRPRRFYAGQVIAASLGEEEIKGRVESLLSRVTLEEKIGQLTQVGGVAFTPDAPKPAGLIRNGRAGSVLWLSNSAAINELQRIAVEETRLGIPLIFGLDVLHRFRTIFPTPLALAASWDPAMIQRVQSIAAREARVAGIAWTLAPMLDIARDPRWGRLIEGPGEDPFLGAAFARARRKENPPFLARRERTQVLELPGEDVGPGCGHFRPVGRRRLQRAASHHIPNRSLMR
jgi:beta-glucosidase